MEAGAGIEPTLTALQAAALPLCHPATRNQNGVIDRVLKLDQCFGCFKSIYYRFNGNCFCKTSHEFLTTKLQSLIIPT